jgi:ATP-dependent Clp protease ATP-binding subunit ClpC
MEYTTNYKKVIEVAKSIANVMILPEHLILGILNIKECKAFEMLSKIVDTIDIENKLKSFLKDNYKNSDTLRNTKLSIDAENIMMQSQLEAKKFKASSIGTEHLLLSLVRARFIDVKYNDLENMLVDITEKEDRKNNIHNDKTQQKTPFLNEFCTDLTKLASEDMLDPIIGREDELLRIVQILSRKKKNNPVLVGEPGTGKTAIVEGLAQKIVKKQVPDVLLDKRILNLEMGSIVAGTKYRGEFEERMKKMVEELKANKNCILYIDEIHTIVGAGSASGSLDAANILKPALARGELSCIGSTTNDEYRKIEKDGALERRFQKVNVDEPTYDETLIILQNLKKRYEDYHLVTYTDEAILACLKLSDKYITDRNFPDKAIDAMDEAGSAIKIKYEMPIEIIEKEKELNFTIKKKLDMVNIQDFLEAAKLKKEQDKITLEIEKMKIDVKAFRTLNRKIVTAEDIANVISIMTKIPSKNISEDDMTKLINLCNNLKTLIIGQDQAIEKITKAIIRNKAGLNDGKRPIGTFLFLGQTGVGKTHISKKLAELLFNTERDMIRIDMSEYTEKFSVSRLIGAPPGYVGYDEGGQLTEKVRKNPYTIVLLDEIEKAHSDVYNILLQVFDDGQLTDGQGKTVSFKNAIIIMTSNVGSKEVKQRGGGVGFVTNKHSFDKSILDKELKKKFSPEFLNRIDEIVYFNSLEKDDIKKIIDIELSSLTKKLSESDIIIELDDTAKEFILKKGFSEEFGARELRRTIQKYILDELSLKLVMKEIKEKDRVKVLKSIEDENKLEFIIINDLLVFGEIDKKISDSL